MKLLRIGILLGIISLQSLLQAYDPRFVVLVASYNNKSWYKKNLDSIFCQKYPHYRVIYIDDISTDDTGDLVEKYVKDINYQGDFTLIKNREKFLKVGNFYWAIHSCADDEIIVELDGDDWLFDEDALTTLASYYRNPDIWMTYGQYVTDNVHRKYRMGKVASVSSTRSKKIPDAIIAENSIRSYKWVTSHLRTYYAWLYKKIKLQDLLFGDAFYPVTGDLAMAFPMVEMAGYHSRFVSEILYVYNNHSPLSDFRKRPAEQIFTEVLLRKKPPCEPLKQAEIHPFDHLANAKVSIIYLCTDHEKLDPFMKKTSAIETVNNVTVICAHQNEASQEGTDSLKGEILECIDPRDEYIVLMNDSVDCAGHVDFKKAILELEKTQTHAVLLHKHKEDIPSHQRITVFDNVYAWNLKYNTPDNNAPYMGLYRAKDLRDALCTSRAFDGNASFVPREEKFALIIDFESQG